MNALLLVNVGSPQRPTPAAVRQYLNQFLMDPYVLDVPYLLRRLIVSCLILPKRSEASAKKYAAIWTDRGSPLIGHTQDLAAGLSSDMDLPVYVAMRYGEPSIPSTISRLVQDHPDLSHLCVVPAYPHYAMSTTKTALEVVDRVMTEYPNVRVSVLPPFYSDPTYLTVLSDTIRPHLQKAPKGTKLVLSYHGLPERHLKKTDPTHQHCLKQNACCETKSSAWKTCYRHQVFETSKGVANLLNLDPSCVVTTFQSRLGRDVWLSPSTEDQLVQLARAGDGGVVVACPAFISDCLETIEEIGIEAKQTFLDAGGRYFERIDCLNSRSEWVSALAKMCQLHLTEVQ